MKYFTIGSQPGADYSTLATFFAATKTAIGTDVDAPYVVLLQNETHVFGDTTGGTVDSSHYYILRPLGKYWQGEEDVTGCVILQFPDASVNLLPYTQIYGCVFTSIALTSASRLFLTSTNSKIYNCLYHNIVCSTNTSSSKTMCFNLGCASYNCVWNNITLSNTNSGAFILELFGDKYNCVVKNIAFIGTGSKNVDLEDTLYNTFFDCGYSHSLLSVDVMKNCAFMSGIFTGGTPDSSNFYPQSDVNYFDPDGYYASSTCQLHGSGIYPETSFGSVNGIEYWPWEWYDVGLVYFKKNTLVLTQNNQSIIFRTK